MASPSIPAPLSGAKNKLTALHRFYAGTSLMLLMLMVVGFQHFYLQGKAYPGREIPPPIRTLVIVHGVSMSLWVLLYVLQSFLIVAKKHRVHMQVGRVAAIFAVTLLVSGLLLAVQSTRIAPPEMVLWGMSAKEFMAVPFFGILLFAGMVATGVWYRRKPEIHRPMMLFATLSALAAATARITALSQLYQGTTWERVCGPFLVIFVLGALLVAIHAALTRSLDRWFVASYGIVLVSLLLTIQIARTPAWVGFVQVLTR
jgi:hypothetical protein